jgi:hypothetical protein
VVGATAAQETTGTRMQRKLVLVLVDSLRTDMLLEAARSGTAPTFAGLLERGELIGDCASSFPSVTPVCTSEILTGRRADEHRIPGMNWYHRAERRYVEYGSSWEATRTFGLFSALYDTVYNMNMGHLSDEVETLYERFGDAGLRSACTPFLIYRGRTRHELGLDGLLGRVATAAKFHHAVWGPDELFYGELYASRKVPCKPTLARPDARETTPPASASSWSSASSTTSCCSRCPTTTTTRTGTDLRPAGLRSLMRTNASRRSSRPPAGSTHSSSTML